MSSTRKSFVPYGLKNGWTDFQVFGVYGFIWLPWVFMAHIGLPQVPGKPPPPRFLFLAKPFWQLTKWTCHTFWRKWLNRFLWGIRWKAYFCPVGLLCYLGNYAETTWGPPSACFIILKNSAAIYWPWFEAWLCDVYYARCTFDRFRRQAERLSKTKQLPFPGRLIAPPGCY